MIGQEKQSLQNNDIDFNTSDSESQQPLRDNKFTEDQIEIEKIGEEYYQSLIEECFLIQDEDENDENHFEIKITPILGEQCQQQNDEYTELLSPERTDRHNFLLPPETQNFCLRFENNDEDDTYIYDDDSLRFLSNIFSTLESKTFKKETALKKESYELSKYLEVLQIATVSKTNNKKEAKVNRKGLSSFYSPAPKRSGDFDISNKRSSVPIKRSSTSNIFRDRTEKLTSLQHQERPNSRQPKATIPSRTFLKRKTSEFLGLSVTKDELIFMNFPRLKTSSTPPSQKNRQILYHDGFSRLVTPYNTPVKRTQVPKFMESGELCFFRKKSFINHRN